QLTKPTQLIQPVRRHRRNNRRPHSRGCWLQRSLTSPMDHRHQTITYHVSIGRGREPFDAPSGGGLEHDRAKADERLVILDVATVRKVDAYLVCRHPPP